MTTAVRQIISPEARPFLPRHIMLRNDPVRGRWVLLAPERVLVPEDTTVALLQRANGTSSVAEIAADLAATYTAPVEVILSDALELFQDMLDRGYLRLKPQVMEAPNG